MAIEAKGERGEYSLARVVAAEDFDDSTRRQRQPKSKAVTEGFQMGLRDSDDSDDVRLGLQGRLGHHLLQVVLGIEPVWLRNIQLVQRALRLQK